MTEPIDQLATALASAQSEMGNAPLNKVNPHYKNKYADLAAIREATLPALNKHGLSITQPMRVTDAGLVLVTLLAHKSGQYLESIYPLPTGAAPQVLGSALTYAKRYSWASVCGIASEDDDDAETASKAKPNGNGQVAPQPGVITAAQAQTIRNAIKEVDADETAFLTWLKIGKVEDLAAGRYQPAMSALARKKTS